MPPWGKTGTCRVQCLSTHAEKFAQKFLMRKKALRRMLATLGREPFTPTDAQRELVRILVFNETPEPRIAEAVGCPEGELRYWFSRELDYSKEQMLAVCAANMFRLANQTSDLGVSLKANQLMLSTRLRAWREPKDDPNQATSTPLERLSTEQLEAIVALGAPEPPPEEDDPAPTPGS